MIFLEKQHYYNVHTSITPRTGTNIKSIISHKLHKHPTYLCVYYDTFILSKHLIFNVKVFKYIWKRDRYKIKYCADAEEIKNKDLKIIAMGLMNAIHIIKIIHLSRVSCVNNSNGAKMFKNIPC